jgi:peptidoglycan/LPS O-acetylase OafA/YrhL
MNNPSLKRNIELDGLRAIAISLVLGWHLFRVPEFVGKQSVYFLIRGGWSGVDLFFVLSGYLVGNICLQNYKAENFLQVFITRRVLRIWPLYYSLLLLSAAFLGITTHSVGAVPWGYFVLHLQNLYFAIRHGWSHSIVNITWSIGLEECFYIYLPLVVRLVSARTLVSLCIVGLCCLPMVRYLFYLQSPSTIPVTLIRPDGLLIGVAVAAVLQAETGFSWCRRYKRPLQAAWAVLVIAFVGLLMAEAYELTTLFFKICVTFTVTSVFFGLTVLLVVTRQCHKLALGFLSLPWLAQFGKISYFTYLFHMLIQHVLGRMLEKDTLLNSILTVVVVSALAQLSWKLWEERLILFGKSKVYRHPVQSNSERLVA